MQWAEVGDNKVGMSYSEYMNYDLIWHNFDIITT